MSCMSKQRIKGSFGPDYLLFVCLFFQATFFEGKVLQDLYHANDLTSVDEAISD